MDHHFKKHGQEFGVKSEQEYLQIGKDIINNGYKVKYSYGKEIRTGYLVFMGNKSNGNKGTAKFGFVGTNNQGSITTIHVKSGKEFWKMLNQNPKDKTIRPVLK